MYSCTVNFFNHKQFANCQPTNKTKEASLSLPFSLEKLGGSIYVITGTGVCIKFISFRMYTTAVLKKQK